MFSITFGEFSAYLLRRFLIFLRILMLLLIFSLSFFFHSPFLTFVCFLSGIIPQRLPFSLLHFYTPIISSSMFSTLCILLFISSSRILFHFSSLLFFPLWSIFTSQFFYIFFIHAFHSLSLSLFFFTSFFHLLSFSLSAFMLPFFLMSATCFSFHARFVSRFVLLF